MESDKIYQIIKIKIEEIAESRLVELKEELSPQTILLETGLDSLAFATLVVMLELELDVDPFSECDEAFYPVTLSDFVQIYQEAQRDEQNTL